MPNSPSQLIKNLGFLSTTECDYLFFRRVDCERKKIWSILKKGNKKIFTSTCNWKIESYEKCSWNQLKAGKIKNLEKIKFDPSFSRQIINLPLNNMKFLVAIVKLK